MIDILLLVFVLLLLVVLSAGDTTTVASWNLKNFSASSRTLHEIGLIAAVCARFELIALQEIRTDDKAVQSLVTILAQEFALEYDLLVSEPIGTTKERYAFIWRKDVWSQSGTAFVFDDNADDFVRDPFCAPFSHRAGHLHLQLCSQHAVFGATVSLRQAEAAKLPAVYEAALAKRPTKTHFVVLLGDFNLPPDDKAWQALKEYDVVPSINPPAKTTVGSVSLYDNFWLPPALAQKVQGGGQGETFRFESYLFPPDSDDVARRSVSDHRPIYFVADTDAGAVFDSERVPPPPAISTSAGFAFGSWALQSGAKGAAAIGLAAAVASNYAVLALQGVSEADAASVALVLNDQLKIGVWSRASDASRELAFLWRSDKVLAGETQLNSAVATTPALCGLFTPRGADNNYFFCNGDETAVVKRPAASSGSAGIAVFAGRQLGAPTAGWSGDGSLWFARDFEKDDDVSDESGRFVGHSLRELPLPSWLLPPAIAEQAALVRALIGVNLPAFLLLDYGEIKSISVTPRPPTSLGNACALFISEVYEQTGNENAVELFNPTDAPVPLGAFQLLVATNEQEWSDATRLTLEGSVAPHSAFVIAHTDATLQRDADLRSASLKMTGNDAIGLTCNGMMYDAVGDPETLGDGGWTVAGQTGATTKVSLRRRSWVTAGTVDFAVSAGTSPVDSQWQVVRPPSTEQLGLHTVRPLSPQPNCHAFFSAYAEVTCGCRTQPVSLCLQGEIKAVEVFNAHASVPLNLASFRLLRLQNGGEWASATAYALGPGVVEPRARLLITAHADEMSVPALHIPLSGLSRINGNDALALECAGVIVDTIGEAGEAPAKGWSVAGVDAATESHVLTRTSATVFGNGGSWNEAAGSDTLAGGFVVHMEGFDGFDDKAFAEPCPQWDGASLTSGRFCCRLDVHCPAAAPCRNQLCTSSALEPSTSESGVLVLLLVLGCAGFLGVTWFRQKPAAVYRYEKRVFPAVARLFAKQRATKV